MCGLNAQKREAELEQRVKELETALTEIIGSADVYAIGRVVPENVIQRAKQLLSNS